VNKEKKTNPPLERNGTEWNGTGQQPVIFPLFFPFLFCGGSSLCIRAAVRINNKAILFLGKKLEEWQKYTVEESW